jgi:hypothetical protein
MQDSPKTPPLLPLWLIVLSLLNSCASSPVSPVTVYMGDPATASIFGQKGQTSIGCTDPAFENYICVNRADFETILLKNTCK